MKYLLAPSLLSADFSKLQEEILQVEKGGAHMLHLDVMDGHFVPNITFGAPVIKKLRPATKLIFDVHLMIEKPENYIEDFIRAGADIISVHAESTPHIYKAIQKIKAGGIKAGIALNPATPLSVVSEVIQEIDMVLLMTINPGFGGQAYIPAMDDKIKRLRDWIQKSGREIDIQVDGGIKKENIHHVADMGANIFVAGTAIFGQNPYDNTKAFIDLLLQRGAVK